MFCITRPWIGYIFLQIPFLIVLLATIWFTNPMSPLQTLFSYALGPVITFLVSLCLMNCLAIVSVRRMMPNLLTVSKVYYSALGYWSLTNLVILLVSGYGYALHAAPVAFFLFGFCVTCLVTADLLRAFRTFQYQQMEADTHANQTPVVVTVV